MKKFYFVFLIFILISGGLFAQSGWYAYSSATNVNLRSAFFLDLNNGWIAGENGTIHKTVNGGATWEIQNSNTSLNINKIFLQSSSIGWAVGEGGLILKTNDGGNSWMTLNSGFNTSLNTIFFVNPQVGWITGDLHKHFLKTTNGGVNWIQFNTLPPPHKELKDVFFIDENTGWASGEYILKTTNGGQSWQRHSGTQTLNTILFTDINNGYTIGQRGRLYKTINSGSNWSASDLPGRPIIYSLYFHNPAKGWAVGENGSILKTTNNGINWTIQTSPTNSNLRSMNFVNSYVGYAVGDNGVFLKTIDAGGLTLNLNVIIEGFWRTNITPNRMNMRDTVTVELRELNNPTNILASSKNILDSLTGFVQIIFPDMEEGTYYIVVKHRNSLETWSSTGYTFFKSQIASYDFTSSQSQAFGNNLILKGNKYCIYSGDINQDGTINNNDMQLAVNSTGFYGYIDADVNGDKLCNATDRQIILLNTNVSVKSPLTQ